MRWARSHRVQEPDALVIVAGSSTARCTRSILNYLLGRSPSCRALRQVPHRTGAARRIVLLAIARAWQTAMQHPRGPVMVSVPADDWDQPLRCTAAARRIPRHSPRPPMVIDALRDAIGKSERTPSWWALRVDRDGAWEQVVAPRPKPAVPACSRMPMSARGSFPEDHALFRGFARAGAQLRERLAGHVVVGGYAPAFALPRAACAAEGSHVPEGARLAVSPTIPRPRASVPEGLRVSWAASARAGGPAAGSTVTSATRRRPAPPEVSATDPPSTAYVLQALARLRRPTDIVVEEAPTARPWMQQCTADDAAPALSTMASGGPGFG